MLVKSFDSQAVQRSKLLLLFHGICALLGIKTLLLDWHKHNRNARTSFYEVEEQMSYFGGNFLDKTSGKKLKLQTFLSLEGQTGETFGFLLQFCLNKFATSFHLEALSVQQIWNLFANLWRGKTYECCSEERFLFYYALVERSSVNLVTRYDWHRRSS